MLKIIILILAILIGCLIVGVLYFCGLMLMLKNVRDSERDDE